MYAPLDLRLVIASVPSPSFYCATYCFTAETPRARRKEGTEGDGKMMLSLSRCSAQARPDRLPAGDRADDDAEIKAKIGTDDRQPGPVLPKVEQSCGLSKQRNRKPD